MWPGGEAAHPAELPMMQQVVAMRARGVSPHDVDLFHTVATVKVPEAVSFGFAAADAEIDFVPELDHYNFRELER